MRSALCFAAAIGFAAAQDPADSWLAYVGFNATGKITKVSTTWAVPAYPTSRDGGNAPGWWFGIEDPQNLYLIQPILAYGDGASEYTIFNGYWQWPTQSWYQSNDYTVRPGDVIFSSLTYNPTSNSYDMLIQNTNKTGAVVKTNIPVQPTNLNFQHLYFVTEHQPNSCSEYPANGAITFYNIAVEVNNKPVAAPQWYATQFAPACNSQAHVNSATSLSFTWATA